ncbi:Response regulator of zinc sigma-54-dependent two-component system [Minicystis rosea]|nr:Response regulator of zinc sigma-54-dependent two-component system [Minicystis rosea]
MPRDVPSTSEHRSPAQPEGGRRRPALVCAFPKPLALALPDSGTVVGRAWLAERGLADTEVSGAHLRIDRAGGALRVADVGSRNGTWVNGARLAPRDLVPLEDGAVVRLGRTLFVFREELSGSFEPALPVGGLVGPFGLRGVAEPILGLGRSRPSNVLIEGETGVGKELVARAAAAALGRETPFAAVNAAGVARGVFESQMFGHVAGAFSDARSAAPGIVVAHDGGTLFLDEIGELDLDLQAKLLRLLENREVLPVGAQRPVKVNVLVVAATNRDLEEMVERGAFRRDLFARLAMARIHIPPLRDRGEDIFSVAAELARRAGGSLTADLVEVEAMERLLLESWPSNVRELDATLAATRRVDPERGLRLWALEEVLGASTAKKTALTQEMVEAALAAAGGNVTKAAEKLGVSRGKLLRHRKRTKSE